MPIVTITHLEMFSAADIRPKPSPDPRFRVMEATTRQWALNRFLYAFVGADWDWRDKTVWSDQEWRDYAESDQLRTFVGYHDGSPAGYFELGIAGGEVQIMYFGLAPAFIGRGFGGHLLTRALQEAWAMKPSRVWVHTCSKDHPAALANYKARGMTVYKEEQIRP